MGYPEWDRAAGSLGLNYREGGAFRFPTIEGDRDGCSVKVVKRNDTEDDWTDYAIGFPPIGIGLRIRKAGLGSRLKRLLRNSNRVTTGDAEFDEAVSVEADDPDRAALVLTAECREMVRSVLADRALVKIDDAEIRSSSLGVDGAEKITRTVQAFISLAGVLSR